MLTKLRWSVVISLTFSLAISFMTSAFAQTGGIYVNQIQIKNNGTVVFTEDFSSGKLSGWNPAYDVAIVTLQKQPLSRALWLNDHGKTHSLASRAINVQPTGTLELSASVYVAPYNQQHKWKNGSTSSFYIGLEYRSAPNKSADTLRTDAVLNPQAQACTVAAKHNSNKATTSVNSKQAVLPTGKWTQLTLRIDPKAGTATTLVDNVQVASVPYTSTDFPKFTGLVLYSDFGDGANTNK